VATPVGVIPHRPIGGGDLLVKTVADRPMLVKHQTHDILISQILTLFVSIGDRALSFLFTILQDDFLCRARFRHGSVADSLWQSWRDGNKQQ
jgi:hypothetical protein